MSSTLNFFASASGSGLFLLAFFLWSNVSAQDVQWASSLIAVSSERVEEKAPGQYAGKQALGKPSCAPGTGESVCAWTPFLQRRRSGEFIKVGFETPMTVRQIAVVENFNPGAIRKVILYGAGGDSLQVFDGKNTAKAGERKGRVWRLRIPPTRFKVNALKLNLATAEVEHWNQIDAIGISEGESPVQVEISVLEESRDLVKENLGRAINSETEELCPVISPDGSILYFTRYNHPDNMGYPQTQDIWFSRLGEDGNWLPAENIGKPLNTPTNNSATGALPDGRLLLLNKYLPNGRLTQGVSVSMKQGEEWTFPKALKIQEFYNQHRFGEYFMGASGKVLIMTLQRKDSYGSKDLYASFLQEDGTWSVPRNLGPTLNTAASETSPFLAADGKTLYFSTRGFPGFGHKDMFVSKRLDDSWTNWSEPLNLGPGLNSPGFDAYYSIPADGGYAYFVSYDGAIGKSDLFRAKLPTGLQPEPVVLLKGKVLNKQTKEPVGGRLIYEDLESGEELGVAFADPTDGSYQLILPAGKFYGFLAEAKGFASINENLNLPEVKEYTVVEQDLFLEPLRVGAIVRLNSVYFSVASAGLRYETVKELDRLTDLMKQNPGMKISVDGHTDDVGKADYNQTLSENRAKEVVKYLIGKGVAAERLKWKGFGERKPLFPPTSPEGRQLNRRVEFRILEI